MKMSKLSLHPLKFSEAVTDILKVKPEPRQPKLEMEAQHKHLKAAAKPRAKAKK